MPYGLQVLTFYAQALLEGGADPEYGQPNAMECITMFSQETVWKDKFEAAPGRGSKRSGDQG
jgi:hypothetical protein